MTARVLSLNLGDREPNRAGDAKPSVTGICKQPVHEAEVRAPGPKVHGLGSGLVGDFIGDLVHHGGDDQAVYAFAREELDYWSERLGRTIESGEFGENLTLEGLDVDGSRIGDRWTVGDEVVLEVTGPRTPCSTFATAMGIKGWVKTFTERGRTGAYLAIVAGGVVRSGDAVELTHRAAHDITVPMTFRAFMGDLESARVVLDAEVLSESDQAQLAGIVARRSSS